jgi:hypothetical protein
VGRQFHTLSAVLTFTPKKRILEEAREKPIAQQMKEVREKEELKKLARKDLPKPKRQVTHAGTRADPFVSLE